jgi:REP element-mobilizing transposase RayT
MVDFYAPLLPEQYYHVYNRGNNQENVFYTPENGLHFLRLYTKYLRPLLDTCAYCLLPNHFHLLVRVKAFEDILVAAETAEGKNLLGLEALATHVAEGAVADAAQCVADMVSNQFRLCFMAYAKAINKQEGRTGSLFQKNFKRLVVASDAHLLNLVLYIHANPQLHGLCGDFRDWRDSSYGAMCSEAPTRLCRAEVLGWFGGLTAFEEHHNMYIDWKTAGKGFIEG